MKLRLDMVVVWFRIPDEGTPLRPCLALTDGFDFLLD
jgi:hypothetical protein